MGRLHMHKAGRIMRYSLAFAIMAAPACAATQSVLHTLVTADGGDPLGELANINGILYGLTSVGGELNGGVIFSLTPAGIPKLLYSLGAPGDGINPAARLISVNGTFYGTTQNGGAGTCNCGTVFSYVPGGVPAFLHSFTGGTDGYNPVGRLTDLTGTLYGTTKFGGTYNGGTVFSISGGIETVIHSFGAPGDGAQPTAGLEILNGVLYGTTSLGGASQGCSAGCGTVFSISASGVETVLYSFLGYQPGQGAIKDGSLPIAGLINVGDTLYGTTSAGGFSNHGTVFNISPTGTEAIMYSFKGIKNGQTTGDGQNPVAALAELNGNFYGTTRDGGISDIDSQQPTCRTGCGIVFEIKPPNHEAVLYQFVPRSNSFAYSPTGTLPAAGLVAVGNSLYGTTTAGGYGGGVVFSVDP